MEILRNVNNAVGRRIVRVRGEREVGIREAVDLWAQHLVFKTVQINKTGPDYSIGMFNRVPLAFGKEKQKPTENETNSL